MKTNSSLGSPLIHPEPDPEKHPAPPFPAISPAHVTSVFLEDMLILYLDFSMDWLT